jgi:hypothetical protein
VAGYSRENARRGEALAERTLRHRADHRERPRLGEHTSGDPPHILERDRVVAAQLLVERAHVPADCERAAEARHAAARVFEAEDERAFEVAEGDVELVGGDAVDEQPVELLVDEVEH